MTPVAMRSKYQLASIFVRYAFALSMSLGLVDCALGAPTYIGATLPPAVATYMDALLSNYPPSEKVAVEIGEVAIGNDGTRTFVVIHAMQALVLNVKDGIATSKAWLNFTLTAPTTKCGDSKTAPCIIEVSVLPSADAKQSAIMIRSRIGCGVARWDSSDSFGEIVDCSVTPRDYVMTWADCRAAGGSIGALGPYGISRCVHRAEDGGKACKDDSECQFGCQLSNGGHRDSEPAAGRCATNDSYVGCWTNLKDGKEVGRMCVD